jgi:hypothetical protein
MKKNFSSLKKNIPNKVRVKPRIFYEVLWSEDFHFDKEGQKTYGITRFDPRQIVINKNQPDKESCHTYFHEFLHAVSHEYEVNLTENQVIALEKSFNTIREFVLSLEGKKNE